MYFPDMKELYNLPTVELNKHVINFKPFLLILFVTNLSANISEFLIQIHFAQNSFKITETM